MKGRRKRDETKANNCLGYRGQGQEKDVSSRTINGNAEPRIRIEIGEQTRDAWTWDDTTREGANEKGREKSLP